MILFPISGFKALFCTGSIDCVDWLIGSWLGEYGIPVLCVLWYSSILKQVHAFFISNGRQIKIHGPQMTTIPSKWTLLLYRSSICDIVLPTEGIHLYWSLLWFLWVCQVLWINSSTVYESLIRLHLNQLFLKFGGMSSR